MQPRLLTKRKIFSGQLVSAATPAIRTGHVLHSLQTSWLRSTSQCWRNFVLRLLDLSNQRRRQHPHPLMQRLSRSKICNGHNSSVARKILSCLLLSSQFSLAGFYAGRSTDDFKNRKGANRHIVCRELYQMQRFQHVNEVCKCSLERCSKMAQLSAY